VFHSLLTRHKAHILFAFLAVGSIAYLPAYWLLRRSVAEPAGEQAGQQSESQRPAATAAPQYSAAGELLLPEDFANWIFVGSNLGLEYRSDDAPADPQDSKSEAEAAEALHKANFHNVYINPEAYAEYCRTGTFPEKTVLVLDIYRAERGQPGSVVSQGLFPGTRKEIAVAVKNSQRPDGSKTNWAYYDFPIGQRSAKAFPDKACYDCHLKHADRDNVWVQFYPILRDRTPKSAP
jgi:Cytochrome P460